MSKAAVEEQTEALRQLVIASKGTPTVAVAAEACLSRLNALYRKDPTLFSVEDVRWLNVLRGTLGLRLAAHKPGGPFARMAKPKGVKLDHCWRCETPLDARFNEFCPECSTKTCRWPICPVCQACGCAREGKTLV